MNTLANSSSIEIKITGDRMGGGALSRRQGARGSDQTGPFASCRRLHKLLQWLERKNEKSNQECSQRRKDTREV